MNECMSKYMFPLLPFWEPGSYLSLFPQDRTGLFAYHWFSAFRGLAACLFPELFLPLVSYTLPVLLWFFLFLLFVFHLFICSFIYISWRLFTLQYCSGFCHTLTWISHGFTCVPHPEPPSHLPIPSLWVFPVHQPQALVSCIQPGFFFLFPLACIISPICLGFPEKRLILRCLSRPD